MIAIMGQRTLRPLSCSSSTPRALRYCGREPDDLTPTQRPHDRSPMRATIFEEPGKVSVQDRPTPDAGPGEVRLRVAASSLCASDVRVYRGEKYARAGVIPGHEIAGVVDEVGEGVAGVAEGDLVLLVDPGAAPSGGSSGRPRSVLRSLVLEHYEPGVLGIWAEPEEWAWWDALPLNLGAAPMVLRVAPGTDVDDVAERLDDQWLSQWQQAGAN